MKYKGTHRFMYVKQQRLTWKMWFLSACQDVWGAFCLAIPSPWLKCSLQRKKHQVKWLEIFLYLYHLVNKVAEKCHCVIFTCVWETSSAVRNDCTAPCWKEEVKHFTADFYSLVGSLLNSWDIQAVSGSRRVSADSPWQCPLPRELSQCQSAEELPATALTPAQQILPTNPQVSQWDRGHHQSPITFWGANTAQCPEPSGRAALALSALGMFLLLLIKALCSFASLPLPTWTVSTGGRCWLQVLSVHTLEVDTAGYVKEICQSYQQTQLQFRKISHKSA